MRIMIVDDDPGNLNMLKRILASNSAYKIETFESPVEALDRLRKEDFELILSDYRMPEIDGISFLVKCKLIQPLALRILVTAFCDKEVLLNAINTAHIHHYVIKPINMEEVKKLVADALKYRSEEIRLCRLNALEGQTH